MLKGFRLSAMIMTLGVGSLFAASQPGPGEWKITGEYVFFKPSVDDTYFVTQSPVTTTFPNGKTKNNDPDFQSGFRVAAEYGLCECGRSVLFDYLRVQSEQDKTVSGAHLWATNGRSDFTSSFEDYAGSAESHLNTLYERADLLLVQQAGCLCDVEVDLGIGLEYAFLRFQENYRYNVSNGVAGDIFQKSHTWGIGPQIGFGLNYCLGNIGCWLNGNWSLNLLSSASLLAAETSTKERNALSNTGTILSVVDSSTWRLIPALHARIGFTYEDCCCWGDYELSAGYEFSSYIRGTARTLYPDDIADGWRQTNYYNFDVQGLYVSAAFKF